jgi:hypothetical protein
MARQIVFQAIETDTAAALDDFGPVGLARLGEAALGVADVVHRAIRGDDAPINHFGHIACRNVVLERHRAVRSVLSQRKKKKKNHQKKKKNV